MEVNTDVKTLEKKNEKQEEKKTLAVGQKGLVIGTVEELYRLAKGMVSGGIAPKGMTAEGALAVMAFGMELGLSPIQSLKDICFINGRPSAYGDAISALLLASGKLTDLPTVEWSGEGDERQCVVTMYRRGMKNPSVGQFSMKDAKIAKLLNKGSDSPWYTYPDRMLKWRAYGWAARDGFSDVLKGLWVREEVEDMERAKYDSISTSEPTTEKVEFSEEWKVWCGLRAILGEKEKVAVFEDCEVEHVSPQTEPETLQRLIAAARRELQPKPPVEAEPEPVEAQDDDDEPVVGVIS